MVFTFYHFPFFTRLSLLLLPSLSSVLHMESEGTPTASTSAVVSYPPQDPEISPVGSPVSTDPQVESPPSDDDHSSGAAVVLTDDLRDKIIKQVEYYFSDENLPTDKYMMSMIKKNKKGFVPIGVIASFRKMKKLIQDKSVISVALRKSSLLVVSSDGKRVKRRHPLPSSEVKDPKLCTVLVENLPEDHSKENIQRLFGEAGNIKNICIHDPHAVEDLKKGSKTEKLLSGKSVYIAPLIEENFLGQYIIKDEHPSSPLGCLYICAGAGLAIVQLLQSSGFYVQLHALVEYDTEEAAEKAVATLNNEDDWRNGMRVKLLKPMVKYGQRNKAWREPELEKNSNVQGSDQAGDEENHNLSEHHDETPDEEDGDHLLKEKIGHRGRRRGRPSGQKYHSTNGQGHGSTSTAHIFEASKPPPGPKMPDGTRGFAMGRGRPPII